MKTIAGPLLILLIGTLAGFTVNAQSQGDVRLVNDNSDSACSGRVEIYNDGDWGTICEDSWDDDAAEVVCRQMNCGSLIVTYEDSVFGPGSGDIWLDGADCDGDEAALTDCDLPDFGDTGSCDHDDDVSVVCEQATPVTPPSPPVRLVGTDIPCAGRVEVFHNGEWGTVCDDDWDISDAEVVCQQLSCGSALLSQDGNTFGMGNGPIWMSDAECQGDETSLLDCEKDAFAIDYCDHDEDAGVVCEQTNTNPTPRTTVRLANSDNRCQGRVEFFSHGYWGTVCDAGWDQNDAEVVCRQLGCGAATQAVTDLTYGEGTGPVWLDGVDCTGDESLLSDCAKADDVTCGHDSDAGVQCEDPEGIEFSGDDQLDISDCPITFYGKTYDKLFVSFVTDVVAICFSAHYDENDDNDDCIIGARYTASSGVLRLHSSISSNLESHIKENLANVMGSGICFYELIIDTNTRYILHNFGAEAVFFFTGKFTGDDVEITILANTEEMVSEALTVEEAGGLNYFDISGCRHEDGVFKEGDEVLTDSDHCKSSICTFSSTLESSQCGLNDRCVGIDECELDISCIVNGPTLIDVHNNVSTIRDRCSYHLLNLDEDPDFMIHGHFGERRRKDISLLESLELRSADNIFRLASTGKVYLDGVELTLTDTPTMHGGVELSKDSSGIMAKKQLTGHAVHIFFDGNMAKIRIEGPPEVIPDMAGLCAQADNFDGALLSDDNPAGCYAVNSEDDDPSINCDLMTINCNILREAPFSDCNERIDPTPYINACSQTMCTYPNVDGLYCHFVEAYIQVCETRLRNELDNWRVTPGCDAPVGFCGGAMCSPHEYCAVTSNGDLGCFCRALYAEPLKAKGIYGELTFCVDNTAKVTLIGCLLEENSVDYTKLHLNDESCRGERSDEDHMVAFTFDRVNTCGTVVTANETHVMYKNLIQHEDNTDNMITREDQVHVDFACFHNQPETKIMSFTIKENSVVQHIVSEKWDYTLSLMAFTDATHLEEIHSNTDIFLDQKVWVVLTTDGLDTNLVAVVTDSCWATTEDMADADMKHYLISDGCSSSDDDTVTVYDNGDGLENSFSFNMFQFSGSRGNIFLHCKIQLCDKQNHNCSPDCGKNVRKRRSLRNKYLDDVPAIIGLTWTN